MLCAEVVVVADTAHEWGDDANLAGDAPNTQLQCTDSVFWAVQSQHQQLSSGSMIIEAGSLELVRDPPVLPDPPHTDTATK